MTAPGTDRFPTSLCKNCGRRVVFAYIGSGDQVALDVRPEVYSLGTVSGVPRAKLAPGHYVAHIASACAHASMRSARKLAGLEPLRLWLRPYREPEISLTWKNEVSNRPVPNWREFVSAGGGG